MQGSKINSSLDISASGLSVQRRRMETISRNLANVETTRTENGGPYQREIVIVREDKELKKFDTILNHFTSRLARSNPNHFEHPRFRTQNKDDAGGVEIDEIALDNSPPRLKYDPHHPDADENGYVRLPNINVVTEMVDMISATRAYEANLTAIEATKNIVKKSLEI